MDEGSDLLSFDDNEWKVEFVYGWVRVVEWIWPA